MDVSISFGKRTLVMGIINVTPDSFYAGSRTSSTENAVARALEFEEHGADIIDIGGESSRPGAASVGADEEMERVIPVIRGIRERSDILISVDTSKPSVAATVLKLGARIINDITGLGTACRLYTPREDPSTSSVSRQQQLQHSSQSEELGRLIASHGAYVILMHMRGTPQDMQSLAVYDDVAAEVSRELDFAVEAALAAGIDRDRIIIDPGIGFAKTAEHNLEILRKLPLFKKKGFPLLVGLSRKSFLGMYTGKDEQERLVSTVAANAISIFQGADIIRVHDLCEAVDTARIVDAIVRH